MTSSRYYFLIFTAFFCYYSTACQSDSPHVLINNHKIFVEVADTPALRQIGLMHRRNLEADYGMLFIFEQEEHLSFWMKNTFIPLSIAFIDSNYRIVDIRDMQPLDESSIRSRLAAKYALEVNQGFFLKNGIKVGDSVIFHLH